MKSSLWWWCSLILLVGCRREMPLGPEDYPALVGVEFPNFELKDLSGRTLRWDELKGQPALINFWFAKCPPCVAEMPHLNAIKSDFAGEGVLFLGITPDDSQSTAEFLTRHRFEFELLPDAAPFIQFFGNEFPMNVFVDKQGIIRHARGAIPTTFDPAHPQGFMDDREFRRILGNLIRE